MKKFNITTRLAILFPVMLFSFSTSFSEVGKDVYVSELFPVAARTQVVGTYGSYAIDRINYKSCIALLTSAKSSAGSACTLSVFMQESASPTVGTKELRSASSVVNKYLRKDSTALKIGCKFTQSGARQINGVSFWLKKLGTITSGKVVIASLQTNNGGLPSGTLVSADAIDSILVDSITSSFKFHKFTFQRPIDVATSTIYHFVIDGDYALSDTNRIAVGTKTVGSGGDYNLKDSAAWNATVSTTQVLAFDEEYNFTSISGDTLTSVTELAPSHQIKSIDLRPRKRFIRAKATIVGTSASYQCGASLILGEPKWRPTY